MKEYIVRCETSKITVDGEIVRCKDCEFCIVEEPISRGIIPDMYCRIWQSSVSTDDFCSYGERKEKVQLSQETPTNSKMETVETSTCNQLATNLQHDCKLESDLISRQAAIDVIMSEPINEPKYPAWWACKINSLPPVEPKIVCDDCISRETVMEAISNCEHICDVYGELKKLIENIPSVEPGKRTEKCTETHACDCISRQAAIKALGEEPDISQDTDAEWAERDTWARHIRAIESLPPVEPPKKVVAQIKVNTDEIVKRVKEKYEITDCPVCEDAISRADTIKAMCSDCEAFFGDDTNCADCNGVAVVRGMPPVEPERPKGKWGDHGECPFCSYLRQWENDRFCGNCGADMRKAMRSVPSATV